MKNITLEELLKMMDDVNSKSGLAIENRMEKFNMISEFCGFTQKQKDILIDKGFLTSPASATHHLNRAGGLFTHSLNVVSELCDLTVKLNLMWDRPESPAIIGMLHDVCKLGLYRLGTDSGTYSHIKNSSPYPGHGVKSLMVIDDLGIKLTREEKLCILHHMGAYEKDMWDSYDAAIRECENVLWTHTADMVASKLMED